MKIFIATLFLLMHQLAIASPGPQRQIYAVEQLNDMCGDAWCESSIDFIFSTMECSFEKGQCFLKFTTQENVSNNQPLEAGYCLLTSIRSGEHIFDYVDSPANNTPDRFLKASFLDQVNRCLTEYMK